MWPSGSPFPSVIVPQRNGAHTQVDERVKGSHGGADSSRSVEVLIPAF
jgi:hypothetical protein